LSVSERWQEIRTGFERPFWVANISELFERLSYYAAFASLARYLHETLNFGVEQASSLSGLFGGLVWFLAAFGGTLADRLGFRRSLSLAYLILSCSYFLLGSIGAPWLAPVRNAMPLGVLVTMVLMLPALGVALVKPCVVGTTARASKENVRSIGYSIYYTLVNIGGAAGPYVASWVHQHMRVENVFRVAALSTFLMFFAVVLLFKEPRRSDEAQTVSLGQAARNFWAVISNPRFMIFLLIFSGYWVVYWQEFIILPLYVHDYINPNADTELMLITGPLTVICLQILVSFLTKKIPAFTAITLGTLISGLAWILLLLHPTVPMVYATLFVELLVVTSIISLFLLAAEHKADRPWGLPDLTTDPAVGRQLNDPRVPYWEPAKWVAKLRTVAQSERPIVLKTLMGSGHSGPSGRYESWREEAYVTAFVFDQLGVLDAPAGQTLG